MDQALAIYQKSSIDLLQTIQSLRETKGREKQVLKIIDQARDLTLDQAVNLLFEMALTHQHLLMLDADNPQAWENMRVAVEAAQKFISSNNLDRWKSRLYRFSGRVLDYEAERLWKSGKMGDAKTKFTLAKKAYRQAITTAELDPEFIRNPYRSAEYRAFIAYNDLMIQGESALIESENLYREFNDSKWGQDLKSRDYFTWAVWISGIVVRTAQAALLLKISSVTRSKLTQWIKETEKLFTTDFDFSYRQMELKNLLKQLRV